MARNSPVDKKYTMFILIIVLIFMMSTITALVEGSAQLSFGRVFGIIWRSLLHPNHTSPIDTIDQKIIIDIRLPRIILAFIIGAALSIAGVVYQSLFRNPMADPSVLGTSSGAALGAAVAIATGIDFRFMGLSPIPIAAFTGAILVTFLVYNLAKTGDRIPMTHLLLAGITASTFLSSIISMILILKRTEMYNIMSWLMGGVSLRRWTDVAMVLPYILIGLIAPIMYRRELNLILLGEERAQQLGLNSNRFQKIMVLSTSLLVAGAVSVSGIIGFVGLLVPHIVRLFIGPDHKYLLPGSALTGGTFLLISDTISRTIMSPLELPVGVVTALCGAPFFLYLLQKSKRTGEAFK